MQHSECIIWFFLERETPRNSVSTTIPFSVLSLVFHAVLLMKIAILTTLLGWQTRIFITAKFSVITMEKILFNSIITHLTTPMASQSGFLLLSIVLSVGKNPPIMKVWMLSTPSPLLSFNTILRRTKNVKLNCLYVYCDCERE